MFIKFCIYRLCHSGLKEIDGTSLLVSRLSILMQRVTQFNMILINTGCVTSVNALLDIKTYFIKMYIYFQYSQL